MAAEGDIVVGLDIGTTKIAAVIGEVTATGVDLIGVGTSPSEGLRQGVVVNIEATTNAIAAAVHEAEQMAAVEVQSVYVGIGGGHIRGFNSLGQVSMREREVGPLDVARVIEQAKAVNIPLDQQIVHTLPLEYIIDGQGQIRDPIGMSGVRMEVKAHILVASATAVQNIVKCCQRAGYDVVDFVAEPLASSLSVLHEDEMDLGVAMIDLGGGTTDISIYHEGQNVYSSVLVMGGRLVSQDIAHGLRTSAAEAEQLKIRHGCALVSMVDGDELVTVPGVGGRAPRQHERRFLAEVIEPRVEEILTIAWRQLDASGQLQRASSGIVLTGGQSLMEGMVEIAEDIFQMPVRRGAPLVTGARGRHIGIAQGGFVEVVQDPRFATAAGLVLYGARHEPVAATQDHALRSASRSGSVYRRIVERMRELF
jgi:cell division protein FtsA